MKASYCTRYGPPEYLQLRDVAIPEPGDYEVLVKIHATPVTAADTMMRRGVPRFARLFLGLRRPSPSVTGTGFSGRIKAIGAKVTDFGEGDEVFGETGLSFGAHAEYAKLDARGVILHKPAEIGFEQAAPLADGALTSLNFLSAIAGLQPGQSVLIVGASGGLGSAAVQLARHMGAEVTGVCSRRNFDLVTQLGAHHLIDYRETDYTKGNVEYDVVFDSVGKSNFRAARRILSARGIYMSPVLTAGILWHMLATARGTGQRARFSATGMRPAADLLPLLARIRAMAANGTLITVIDRAYPLAEIRTAHGYVDKGHKRGNVIVTPA